MENIARKVVMAMIRPFFEEKIFLNPVIKIEGFCDSAGMATTASILVGRIRAASARNTALNIKYFFL